METQQVPVHSSAEDPIESFSDDPKLSKGGDVPMDQDEATVDCECGVEVRFSRLLLLCDLTASPGR